MNLEIKETENRFKRSSWAVARRSKSSTSWRSNLGVGDEGN
jgi:hypothetical protein